MRMCRKVALFQLPWASLIPVHGFETEEREREKERETHTEREGGREDLGGLKF